tara:strand:- start:1668 stop:1817 length:150 start_codon:yes stop_codon:yes gene_type:complete
MSGVYEQAACIDSALDEFLMYTSAHSPVFEVRNFKNKTTFLFPYLFLKI